MGAGLRRVAARILRVVLDFRYVRTAKGEHSFFEARLWPFLGHVSYSLNSLKGGYIGII